MKEAVLGLGSTKVGDGMDHIGRLKGEEDDEDDYDDNDEDEEENTTDFRLSYFFYHFSLLFHYFFIFSFFYFFIFLKTFRFLFYFLSYPRDVEKKDTKRSEAKIREINRDTI